MQYVVSNRVETQQVVDAGGCHHGRDYPVAQLYGECYRQQVHKGHDGAVTRVRFMATNMLLALQRRRLARD